MSVFINAAPAAAAPPAKAPACETTGPDEASAAAMAKRCGQRVEVLSGRSESVQVFANPDGSSTFTASAVPTQVHRPDGSWAAVDTTLKQRPDGSVAPVATVVDMVFSGGGSGPFATYLGKGGSLTVGLPVSLPKPTLSGSTASYADVLAGVDLRVTASATGFRHVLVVKTAAALANPALADLRMSVGGDVVAAPAADGQVRFADKKGRTVAVSGAASMWDSTVDPGSNGEVKASTSRAFLDGLKKAPPVDLVSDERRPGATAKSAIVGVRAEADGHGVRLTPDAAMLKNAALPLFIDPPISLDLGTWAYSRSINSNYAVNGQAWIGVNPPCCGGDGSTFRSFFDFPTTSANGVSYTGKHIISATFNIMLNHSYSCTPTWVNAYHSIGPIYVGNGGRMTWGDRPLGSGVTWIASQAANANKAGGCGTTQPDFLMTFSGETMRADVQSIADQMWGVYPIGLCTCDANGANESAQDRWKRFNVDGNTKMSVTYNTVPTAPDNLSPHQGQVACNGIVGTTSPELTARYADSDTQDTLSAVFHWQELPSGPVNTANGPSKPANNFGSVTLNLGAGSEGKTYQFQVQTTDAYDSSPWSPWCQFTVDTTAPPMPNVTPTGAGPVYTFCDPAAINSCTPVGGPGVAGAFKFGEPAGPAGQDVIRYVYGWDAPSTPVTVSAGADSPAILLTPPHYGLNKLMVFSVDGTGHASSTRVFTVLVGEPDGSASAAKAYWPLDTIDNHLYKDQVSGSTLTTSGVAMTDDVRYFGFQGALFDGTGEATQSVPAFDTSGSFSVAAWVNPAATCANNHTMVSIDADSAAANNHASAFTLNLDCTNMRFTMDVSDQNTATPNHLTALSANGSAVVGRWSFLVGVFDESLNQVQLWVNGALVQTTTASSTWITAHGTGWKATGPVVLGRYLWNNGPGGRFNGAIADVRLWNRVIVADDINGTVADPNNGVPAHPGLTTPLSVGSWEFADGNCFCDAQTLDGSVFGHTLTLYPDFAVDPSADQNPDTAPAWLVDGGQDGDGGLRLDGQAGSASTTDDRGTVDPSDDVAHPVVLTNQSFSVQAWANPSAVTGSDQYMLSQGTGSAKAFRLYLRGSDHKWVFEVSTPDGAGGYTWATAVSDAAAVPGRFTRLSGAFDAATGATRLAVDGAYQITYAATGGGGWKSTGSLTVGSGNTFAGTVDDIDVWQGGPGFTVTPTGAPLASIAGSSAWVLNGSAAEAGSDLVLTPADINKAGSAVYSTPIASNGLRAEFTVQIGGGTGGADGQTFAMLNAATSTPHSLGGNGGGLGFSGLSGVAVTFDTYQNGSDPSNNFIGLATDPGNGQWIFAATATNVPNLRTGTHAVVVAVTGTSVTVSIDGVQVISATAAVPASVRPAFTAATGGYTDQHIVRAVTITSGGTVLPAPDDSWRFNGSAAVNGSSGVLTPAQSNVAGSALYARPVATDGLTASFGLTMNGGSGADGATFALLDPASATPTSVGGVGGSVGFGGLAGVAAEFLTYPQGNVTSHNYVAVATSTVGGGNQLVATSTNVPDLRSGTHAVVVRVVGTTITISVDNAQVLSTSVPSLPPSAIVGFTAATGGLNDVHAVTNVQVTTAAKVVPAPFAAGWRDNGSATTNGGTIQLTAAAVNQAGTAIFGTAVPTARLRARFTIQIGGGTGADGLTFMLLDPAQTSPTSLGDMGGGLGYEGLAGVAVTFITYQQTAYTSNNFVGVATGGTGGTLTFAGTSTNVPALRTGTHVVDVSTSTAGHLVVAVDGVQVLDVAVSIPANAFVGFSGSTGGRTDVHTVSGIGIEY